MGFQESIAAMPTDVELDACVFNDNHQNITDAGLKAGSKYVRMVWQDFEPTDDNFQFDRLDKILDCAHDEGKSVDLRVMLSWPGRWHNQGEWQGLPDWLINKPGVSEGFENGYQILTDAAHVEAGIEISYSIPNWENQVIWDEHAELINALGARYDGHKDINSIDIGSVGFFGEWHYEVLNNVPNSEFLPSQQKKIDIIDLYYDAFPNTLLNT